MDDTDSESVTLSCQNHHETLINGLWNFYQFNYGVDFDVHWYAQSQRVHRLVLDLFLSPNKLSESANKQKWKGTNGRCLEFLLEFLYRGQVTVPKNQLANLKDVAEKSEFKMLVDVLARASKGKEPAGVVSQIDPDPKDEPQTNRAGQEIQREIISPLVEAVNVALNMDFEENAEEISPGSHQIDSRCESTDQMNSGSGSRDGQESAPSVDECANVTIGSDSPPLQNSVQPNPWPFRCEECQREFDRLSSLVNHRRVHVAERRRSCTNCSREFEDARRLQMHVKIHAVLRSSCRKRFKINAKELAKLPRAVRDALVLEGVAPVGASAPVAVAVPARTEKDCKSRFYQPRPPAERDGGPQRGTWQFSPPEVVTVPTPGQPKKVRRRSDMPSVDCYQKTMSRKLVALQRLSPVRDEKLFRCFVCRVTFDTRSSLVTHADITGGHQIPGDGSRLHLCLECGERFKTGNALRAHQILHDKLHEETLERLIKLRRDE